jgi:hypothetical protein
MTEGLGTTNAITVLSCQLQFILDVDQSMLPLTCFQFRIAIAAKPLTGESKPAKSRVIRPVSKNKTDPAHLHNEC